jgi:hypothetical protein
MPTIGTAELFIGHCEVECPEAFSTEAMSYTSEVQMKKCELFATIIALVFCFALTTPDILAQTGSDRESLRGLTGVGVYLRIDDEAIEAGLTPDQVGTDVTVRIRKAGIRVFDGAEANQPKGRARIVVKVKVEKVQTGIYTYSLSSVLMQEVVLVGSNTGRVFYATTWDSSWLTGVTSGDLRQTVRSALGDVIDKFINDYLAVNPKP